MKTRTPEELIACLRSGPPKAMKSAEQEISELDAMLNAAIEAAGLDPTTATADDLLAWILERRAEEWQDIETAPKDCDVWVYGANGRQGTATWDESLKRHVSGVASKHTHWRPIPKGPQA